VSSRYTLTSVASPSSPAWLPDRRCLSQIPQSPRFSELNPRTPHLILHPSSLNRTSLPHPHRLCLMQQALHEHRCEWLGWVCWVDWDLPAGCRRGHSAPHHHSLIVASETSVEAVRRSRNSRQAGGLNSHSRFICFLLLFVLLAL
jgi:hypothetical protein